MGKEIIPLGVTKEIPLNLLRLSEKNVRSVQAAEGIDALAADIARRGLLQSLCVRELKGDPAITDRQIDPFAAQILNPIGGRDTQIDASIRLLKAAEPGKKPKACDSDRAGYSDRPALASGTDRADRVLQLLYRVIGVSEKPVSFGGEGDRAVPANE
jgi:hypothetical protein